MPDVATPASISGIGVADVTRFRARHYGPVGTVVAMAAGPDLAVIDGTDAAAVTDAASGVDGLLTANPDLGGVMPHIAYTLLSVDGIDAADPVRWALLTGADRLTLAVAGRAVAIEVTGATYGHVITACATRWPASRATWTPPAASGTPPPTGAPSPEAHGAAATIRNSSHPSCPHR
jgi:hypothetical protein